MEKSCFNCKYFLRYYIKRGLSFHSLSKGHCTYDFEKKATLCENWQDDSESSEKFENQKKQFIEKISKQFWDIFLIESSTISS